MSDVGGPNDFGPLALLTTPHGDRVWDFTLLFEDAFLVLGPLGLGILFLLAELAFKVYRKPGRTTRSFNGVLWFTKVALYTVLAGLALANVVLLPSLRGILISELSYAAAAIVLVFVLSLASDNLVHHVVCLHPSTPSQLFLSWWLLSDVATIRTRWLLGENNRVLASVGIVSAAAKLAVLVVEEWSKRRMLLPEQSKSPPEGLAGVLNRMLLIWINPLMYKGLFGILTLEDLWPLEHEFSTAEILNRLRKKQDGTRHSSEEASLLWVLFKENMWLWVAPVPARIVQAALEFTQPFLITRTLYWLYISTPDSSTIGYGLLGAYAVVYIGIALATAFGQYQSVRMITILRGNLMTQIFQESLKGEIVESNHLAPLTLMSTNIDRIVDGLIWVQESIVAIPQLGVALWLLQRQVGLGAIGPVVVVGVAAVGIGACAGAMNKAQKQWLDAVKERVQFATQVLGGFQSAKMSGLMGLLANRLQASRMKELRISLTLRRFLVLVHSLALGTPNLSPVLTLGVYAAILKSRNESLNEIQAFGAIAYLNLITIPLLVLVGRMPNVIGAYSSLKQIDDYFRQGRSVRASKGCRSTGAADGEKTHHPTTTAASSSAITVANCTLQPSGDRDPVLHDLNIEFTRSAFTFIIGPSASGKTTLLQALLGETTCAEGSISFNLKDVAYAAQRPWIRGGSVRDNIVSASSVDDKWYQEVIHACALDRDAGQLSHDAGTGGTSLSGGQKQKVSLARAVYSRRKLLIIDEPFTGIDGTSCELIAQRLLGPEGLLRRLGTTLILASHSTKYVSFADHVVALGSNQRVAQQGPPQRLDLGPYADREAILQKGEDIGLDTSGLAANPVAYALTAQDVSDKPKDRRNGEMAAYFYYFQSLGWWKLLIAFSMIASFVFLQLFTQPWVTWWTTSNVTDPNNRLGYWLGLYATFGFLAILSLAAASWLMLVDMVRESGASLHATLCETVEQAPITLFSAMSPGLTVNRFSQDMSLVDMDLPLSFASVAIAFMLCLGQLGLILSASKYVSIALPFVVAACVIIQRLYIKTSRQLRFLEIESKAPLYTQFIETLNGLATIRAYNLQPVLENEMVGMIDTCQKPFYLLYCAQRYLGLTLNLTVAGLAVLMVGVANAIRGRNDTTYYGLALVNIMVFGTFLAEYINEWCQFEVNLAAVERTKDFAENTPRETTDVVANNPEKPFEQGVIRIEALSVNYSAGHQVLHDVSLLIPAGEKVAICGRSGSGKSTLCYAMLRMLEAAQGTICIDDREIARIPHDDLRSHIACVPQDPLLLEGSLRCNLDPFEEHADLQLRQILQKVGLWENFASQDQGLNTALTSDLLSTGEKQLICLARALLKQSKVLVLDEATSSVDAATDKKIQEVICKSLPGVTVISVMHRFDSIRMYDRIVLISGGNIAEDGAPQDLLAKPTSLFSQMHRSEQHG